jgi:hypothetical protein
MREQFAETVWFGQASDRQTRTRKQLVVDSPVSGQDDGYVGKKPIFGHQVEYAIRAAPHEVSVDHESVGYKLAQDRNAFQSIGGDFGLVATIPQEALDDLQEDIVRVGK